MQRLPRWFDARSILLACCAIVLASCQTRPVAPPERPAAPAHAEFVPASYPDLPGWNEDRVEAAWPALLVGCKALLAKAATRATWQRSCDEAAAVGSGDARGIRNFIESRFKPYRVTATDGKTAGVVSGYYEPLLGGARARSERYSVPLYARPDDLLEVDLAELYPELKGKRVRGRVDGRRVVPYWSRADIDAGRLAATGQPLAYVADPVEAFFFEIQGSGRIRLEDGTTIRLGYADQNGHPYRSVAQVLIDRGELARERASLQAIAAWGRAHPDQLPALLAENPSYVFFREVPPFPVGSLEAQIDGPLGTLGVPLLAQRTVAVDARELPLGAPLFLATTRPLSSEPLRRLVLAQDTGGAIRGPMRIDYFWGFGPDAGREAGRMRQDGSVWVLWPVDAGVPSVQ